LNPVNLYKALFDVSLCHLYQCTMVHETKATENPKMPHENRCGATGENQAIRCGRN
jgi:hypothetical protein